MNIHDLTQRVRKLQQAVEKENLEWIPARHTIFLSQEEYDDILRDKSFGAQPPGMQWCLAPRTLSQNNTRSWMNVNILVVNKLPEGF